MPINIYIKLFKNNNSFTSLSYNKFYRKPLCVIVIMRNKHYASYIAI